MIWSLIDGQIKIVNNNQSILDKEEVWIWVFLIEVKDQNTCWCIKK